MQITYGLLTVLILASAIAGACAGAWIVAIFSASQVTSLQRQLGDKAEIWCKGCDYFKRNADLQDKLQGREHYVRTLEERCAELTRSNRALGSTLQKRTLGVA